jgi:hypothetical protein
LSAFDEFHAEVARLIALAHFINRDNGWMLETGGGFRFATETFEVRLRGPMPQADDLECNRAVETFLPRAINHALTAAADFLLQFVIAEISQHLCPPRCFVSTRYWRAIIAAGVIRLRRSSLRSRFGGVPRLRDGGRADPGYRFIAKQIETCF